MKVLVFPDVRNLECLDMRDGTETFELKRTQLDGTATAQHYTIVNIPLPVGNEKIREVGVALPTKPGMTEELGVLDVALFLLDQRLGLMAHVRQKTLKPLKQ